MENNLKKCPYCAEEIIAQAVKCKHCGEFLNPELKESNKIVVENKSSGLVTFLVILSILALMIIIFGF